MANPYLRRKTVSVTSAVTPQSQPIPGRDMVPNNAGGYGYKLSDWERLQRFLILGSESGTYYVGETKLTEQNAQCVIRCIKEDGLRVVEMARDVNLNNRAPKTDQQLFALALAFRHGDLATKVAVQAAATKMLRIGTHLLHFCQMLDQNGGWSRGKRRIIANWFIDRKIDNLAFQVLKYESRDGWTMRDALRVSHPEAPTEAHRAVFDWICGRRERTDVPPLLTAYNEMNTVLASQDVNSLRAVHAALMAVGDGVPREALRTEHRGHPKVQKALVLDAGLHMILRNLASWTASGAIHEMIGLIRDKLADAEALRRAHVHPFAVLLAALVYGTGHGYRLTWMPVKPIQEVLDEAYELAWRYTAPTNKRVLISIDTSGSMTAPCIGTPVEARTAAAAMAIILAAYEPYYTVVGADDEVRAIMPVTKHTSISSLINRPNLGGGGTDLSAPVRWAAGLVSNMPRHRFGGPPPAALPAQPQVFDAIIILTDNETWAGRMHTSQALEHYRSKIAPNCKLIVCAMAANHVNIVDPNDPLSLGCSGLDANLPAIITEFLSN